MRTVGDVMTRALIGVEQDQTLEEAVELMNARGVRHLLVFDDRQLVGVLSECDVLRFRARKRVSPSVVPVSEAMTPEPLQVERDEQLADVAARMLACGVDAAVVVRHGSLVGVFTTMDALRLLAQEQSEVRAGAA